MIMFGFLCICISLDVFVCALEQGATEREVHFKRVFVYALIFAICSAGLFLLGHGLSYSFFGKPLMRINKFVAIIIFLILGNIMVIYGIKKKKFVERLNESDYREIIKLALLGGIDCFLVGVGCYYMNLSYVYESLILFLVVLVGCIIHYYVGYYNGAAYQKVYYFLCGIVYILMSMSLILHIIQL